jgi:hypothetical protein
MKFFFWVDITGIISSKINEIKVVVKVLFGEWVLSIPIAIRPG